MKRNRHFSCRIHPIYFNWLLWEETNHSQLSFGYIDWWVEPVEFNSSAWDYAGNEAGNTSVPTVTLDAYGWDTASHPISPLLHTDCMAVFVGIYQWEHQHMCQYPTNSQVATTLVQTNHSYSSYPWVSTLWQCPCWMSVEECKNTKNILPVICRIRSISITSVSPVKVFFQ